MPPDGGRPHAGKPHRRRLGIIDLYYWTNPNGHKITMFLGETATPYTIKPVDISKGGQFSLEFLSVSTNHRFPANVDHAPKDGGATEDFPRLKRRFETIRARPATERAWARAREIDSAATVSDARSRQVLFGQTASAVR